MPNFEEIQNINTEIRYITIELMKISVQRKVPFRAVAEEFLENANALNELIRRTGKRK